MVEQFAGSRGLLFEQRCGFHPPLKEGTFHERAVRKWKAHNQKLANDEISMQRLSSIIKSDSSILAVLGKKKVRLRFDSLVEEEKTHDRCHTSAGTNHSWLSLELSLRKSCESTKFIVEVNTVIQ